MSVVVNGDGSITVTLAGNWAWSTKDSDCNLDRFGVGWSADWNDPNAAGNHVTTLGSDSIDVGVATANAYNVADNHVHYYADIPRCGVFDAGLGYNTGTFGARVDELAHTAGFNGFLSHTYAPGTSEIHPCVIVYDIHKQNGDLNDPQPEDLKAGQVGGAGHNGDNSAEENGQSPVGNVCAAVDVEPDLKIVKTGPRPPMWARRSATRSPRRTPARSRCRTPRSPTCSRPASPSTRPVLRAPLTRETARSRATSVRWP